MSNDKWLREYELFDAWKLEQLAIKGCWNDLDLWALYRAAIASDAEPTAWEWEVKENSAGRYLAYIGPISPGVDTLSSLNFYNIRPLYLSPPTANQIAAAAYKRAAEVVEHNFGRIAAATIEQILALIPTETTEQVEPLLVKVVRMSESNGRVWWSVYLAKDENQKPWDSYEVYSSESEGRAQYEADSLRHFLGQAPKPNILSYDTDLPTKATEQVGRDAKLILLLERAAAHVRPTCTDLYNEILAGIASAKQEGE